MSYVANSSFVAQRIKRAWDVHASVIYPPVDIERIKASTGELSEADLELLAALPQNFVLGASRLVPYKNVEAAISAGNILGMPVVLVGTGPDEVRLRRIAEESGVPVVFAGRVSNSLLYAIYRRAELFVYMPIEDFGIMPVESMACGTPVLVNDVGGAQESVLALKGGCTVGWRNSTFSDRSAIEKAMDADIRYAASSVSRFSTSEFEKNIRSWVGA
ncbi:glycosyltransferase [Mycolicibacterium palauense]|uniref:glycosyltransferase n=1 Tax=Mycolicibacterium palauense TaxID=2034511 RepID=UPI001FEB3811